MKTEHRDICLVRSNSPSTVEIDTEAGAAYVRFGRGKVSRTKVQQDDGVLITVDLDEKGKVPGVEIVGVEEFTIGSLLKKVPFLRGVAIEERKVCYVPASKALQPA